MTVAFTRARALAVCCLLSGFVGLSGMATGCSQRHDAPVAPHPTTESTGTTSQALTTSNGLTTNGLWTNGFWTNGFWTNGFWTNGFWTNGFELNGFWTNGFWTNGLWSNGFWTNGVQANTLASNQYSRQLLQYVYQCGMPGSLDTVTGAQIDPRTYDVTLDPNPNNPAFACSTQADCDGHEAGYTCANNKCVVQLTGGIGMGVNADGSGWWQSGGHCDETCQRWVSACVLARTNAYGVHVGISMRVPASAPLPIRRALQLDTTSNPTEACGFPIREGAYYGNIFHTTPVPSTPPPPPPSPPAPSGTLYSGQATGQIAWTPSFYACAGPDSNIPSITQRFCSSQGDQVVINVPGECVLNAPSTPPGTCAPSKAGVTPGVCDGMDGFDPANGQTGAIHGCWTSPSGSTNAEHYDEVVTVYLAQPMTVCGDGICQPPENSATCPNDCHPGTWARDFTPQFGGNTVGAPAEQVGFDMSLVLPDDSVVVTGQSDSLIDFGSPGGSPPVSMGRNILAKYATSSTDPHGTNQWATRFADVAGANPAIPAGIRATP